MKKQYYVPRNTAYSTLQNHSLSQSMLNYHQSPITTSRPLLPQQHSKSKYQAPSISLQGNKNSLHLLNYKPNSHSNISYHQSPQKDQPQLHHPTVFMKQNQKGTINQQQSFLKLLRQLQTRMKQYQIRIKQSQTRIQKTQRFTKNSQKISLNIEEIMKMQLKDIKFNNQLQQRLDIIQSNIVYLKSIKVERKDIQQKYQQNHDNIREIQTKIDELIEHANEVQQEIQQINSKFAKTMEKVEHSFLNMGKKYEQFIESNLIKTIQQMNRLSQHYHEQIQSFKRQNTKTLHQINNLNLAQQSIIKMIEKDRIQMNNSIFDIQLWTNKYRGQMNNKTSINDLIGISIPNLKVITNIKICKESKHNIQLARQVNKFDTLADNILNSLYSKIQKESQQDQIQVMFQTTTYKLDPQFYLLDDKNIYLTDQNHKKIRLTTEQIDILYQNNLIVANYKSQYL